MSITIVASVVCGFPCDIVKSKKEVRKFDENTGEPYLKTVDDGYVLSVNGIDIKKNNYHSFDSEDIDGLSIEHTCYHESAQTVIGKVVGKVEYSPGINVFPTEMPQEVLDFGAKIGLEPKWFLVLYVS